MYRGAVQFGDVELINHQRLFRYLRAGIAPPSLEVVHDDRWPWQYRWSGHQLYETPKIDRAPWYDPARPESGEFAGVWLRSITGIDDATPYGRETIAGMLDGGAHGLGKFAPREMTFATTLYASTHQGLMWGIGWLTRTLTRPVCDDRDATVTMRYLSTVPTIAPDIDSPSAAMLDECTTEYRRALRDVAVTAGPRVTNWITGIYDDGEPGTCAAEVEFTLIAADPHPYHDALVPLAGPLTWAAATVQAVTWRVAYYGICDTSAPTTLVDPQADVASARPRRRPAIRTPSRVCTPLYYKTVTASIAPIVGQGTTVLTVRVEVGPNDERNLTMAVTDNVTGAVVGEVGIAYLPARSTLVLDGSSGTATVILEDGRAVDASSVVTAGTSGPLSMIALPCGHAYTVTMRAGHLVHASTSVTVLGTRQWVV